jgi:hypothetical protein
MPAAVIIEPGARSVRNEAEFEKEVTRSALAPASYTAPTDTASGTHAGELIMFVYELLPEATIERIPAWRALRMATAK